MEVLFILLEDKEDFRILYSAKQLCVFTAK